eukprot:TRINITY_DN4175_c0_g1_i3.p1 TRINITY_DN4175_c0_g1~~TRINITY_DN4175_c0_g1_i3.p1  ORF type:complete len:503 (-),score=87.74 TRINITY_DN4175_c0_g1_i3:44-1552(-)
MTPFTAPSARRISSSLTVVFVLAASACILPAVSAYTRRLAGESTHQVKESLEAPDRRVKNKFVETVRLPEGDATELGQEDLFDEQEQGDEEWDAQGDEEWEAQGEADDTNGNEPTWDGYLYLLADVNVTLDAIERFAAPILHHIEYDAHGIGHHAHAITTTVNKATLALISLLGFGCCGVDRCFAGQLLIGGIKGLLCGGGTLFYFCLSWGVGVSCVVAARPCFDVLFWCVGLAILTAVCDWVLIMLSCFARQTSLQAFGFATAFTRDTVGTAARIALAMPFFTPLFVAIHLWIFNVIAIALRRMDLRSKLQEFDEHRDGLLNPQGLKDFLLLDSNKFASMSDAASTSVLKLGVTSVEDMVGVMAPWPWDSLYSNVTARCDRVRNSDRLQMRWYPWGQYVHEGRHVIEVYKVEERREGMAPQCVATFTYADGKSTEVPGDIADQLVDKWSFKQLGSSAVKVGATQKVGTTYVPRESDAAFATLLRAAKKAENKRACLPCVTR